MSLAILVRETATTLSAPDTSTKASCAPMPSNLLGFGLKATPLSVLTSSQKTASNPAGALSPVPTAVPPCGSRHSRGNVASMRSIPKAICWRKASNAWPMVIGTASMRCVRPIFTTSLKASALVASVSSSTSEGWKQAVAEFEHRREMHHRRKAVVRRLRAIDVIVRVDRLARSEGMPQQLVGPVGDHLVGIHVRLRAGARLPDRQGEVSVEPALPDLPGRCLDGIRQRGGQGAQAPVRPGRRELLKAEGADQGRGEALLADLEERQRPLGLCAPVAVGRNLDLAEGIPLDAHLLSGHGILLGTLGRSA